MKVENMPILRPLPIDTKGCGVPKRLWRWITKVRQWEVMENWEYMLPNDGQRIIIPKGFLFDGASIPRPLWGVLSPIGLLLIPGLIHDFGYRYDYLWARDTKGIFYKYGKGCGQHFWDSIFMSVAKEVNGMAIIDSMAWATLFLAGWWAWNDNRKLNAPELKPESYFDSKLNPEEEIMNIDDGFHKKLTEQLINHEGLRLKPYHCPAGKLTIGIGRNLDDKGISEKEAVMLLENDIEECVQDLKTIFQEFDLLPESVKLALVDMRFNLGPNRFRNFKKMIAAVKAQDFGKAAAEMKDSRWFLQVGRRAETLINMMSKAHTT